jgi:fumarate reductase flavoprotein subunit
MGRILLVISFQSTYVQSKTIHITNILKEKITMSETPEEDVNRQENAASLSRRNFLKGALVTTAAISGGGILQSCAPKVAATSSAVTPESASTPAAAATGACETDPIGSPLTIDASEIKETVTADVVIVGAGCSGITAALTACEAGLKTVVLQKGLAFMTHGWAFGAIGAKIQKDAGQDIDLTEALDQFKTYSGNKIDMRMVKVWAENSGETLDWIIEKTDKANLPASYPYTPHEKGSIGTGYSTAIFYTGGTTAALKILVDEATAKGVDFRYNTPGVQLVKNSDGRVTGVIAKNADNAYVQFDATKAVVLCTGDYGNNPEMVAKYSSWVKDIGNAYIPAYNTGDGHKMAVWAGAVLDSSPHAHMTHYDPSVLPEGDAGYSAIPWLWVNKDGIRFENEEIIYQFIGNGDLQQPGKFHWQIFDSKFADELPNMGAGLGRTVFTIPIDNPQAAIADGVKRKAILQADSLEALADLIGVPKESFLNTVSRYNELVKQGEDVDFGKPKERLTSLEKPPYYAAKRVPGVLTILGGAKVNPKLQVLDKDNNVIPGLYTAGNVSGGFFANDYPLTFGAVSTGRAATFGRVAVKNIVADEA